MQISGHPLHTRSMTMKVSLAADGRWLARGQVIDLRKTGFAPLSTDLQPAGIIHHMCLDLHIDPASAMIEGLSATQPVVAIEPSARSCGESCRDPVAALDAMVGVRLDDEFRGRLQAVFGGPRGCSHLLSLFHFMARALVRGLAAEARFQGGERAGLRAVDDTVFQSSLYIDGFHTAERNFQLSLQVYDFLVRPEVESASALDRFQYEAGARLATVVQTADMSLADMQLGTRERTLDSLGELDWRERSDWAEALAGAPIMGGFGARASMALRAEPEAELMLDGLLQLAPGFIQVIAAVADQWIARTRSGENADGDRPLGAAVDSCYIWREGGSVQGRS